MSSPANKVEIDVSEAVRLYTQEGLTAGAIGAQLNASPEIVLRRLHQSGVMVRRGNKGWRYETKRKAPNRLTVDEPAIIASYRDGLTADKIAAMHGISQQVVIDRLKGNRIQLRRPGHSGLIREANPRWKGGEVDAEGYVAVSLPKDHTFYAMCQRNGYVRRCRLVMAEHLGRLLLATEVVHHKDHDKQHDEISNLHLFASQSEHMKEHARLKKARANNLWEAE